MVNLIGRGYEVVVWADIDSGNYENIVQYVFRDDGSLGFRLGTSGSVQTDLAKTAFIGEAHMHNALWRLSTMLFGRNDNRVYQTEHLEGSPSIDNDLLITTEGWVDWDPLKFTSILVESLSLRNKRNHFQGYELTPFGRTGTSRHANGRTYGGPPTDNSWTKHDFWITRDKNSEDGSWPTDDWRFNHRQPPLYMIAYTSPPDRLDVGGTPVIWYNSSFHHDTSDHDLDMNGKAGIHSVHWGEFDFQPHNTFDYNPMTGGLSACSD